MTHEQEVALIQDILDTRVNIAQLDEWLSPRNDNITEELRDVLIQERDELKVKLESLRNQL